MSKLKYFLALNRAIREEMSRDENVVLFGEDVGESGGIFSQTRGLYEEFGPLRVRDTPIAEGGFVTMGVGAAATGLRPIIEIGFGDFVTACMDGLVNQAAKLRYMLGGQVKVPLVLYTFSGGGLSAGPQHSQCLESWFAHIPGLKVISPSSPSDLLGLFKTAVRDNDPVICFLGKQLVGSSGAVPEANEEKLIPLGKADIKREGKDITIVTYSQMTPITIKAANILNDENGINAEVIDLRSISPLDIETVIRSLEKTGALCVVQEAMSPCSVASEVISKVVEFSNELLVKKPLRITPPFTPSPFSPELEKIYRPSVEIIQKKVIDVLK